jgi:Holliday junction DNA helicase RuvA
MICRLTGRLGEVGAESVMIETGALAYEVLVPRSACAELQRMIGSEVTLFTLEYSEGNPTSGHLIPRIVGFLSATDRDFFGELLKVKGLGIRRALRAMSVPAAQIAAAIENADERSLAALPEVGRRTASQMIAQLRGKLGRFVGAAGEPAPAGELSEAQRLALEILVRWGDRRADAQRWVVAAVAEDPGLRDPEAIVRAAYRIKQQGR